MTSLRNQTLHSQPPCLAFGSLSSASTPGCKITALAPHIISLTSIPSRKEEVTKGFSLTRERSPSVTAPSVAVAWLQVGKWCTLSPSPVKTICITQLALTFLRLDDHHGYINIKSGLVSRKQYGIVIKGNKDSLKKGYSLAFVKLFHVSVYLAFDT